MNTFIERPLALVILDGWGISSKRKGNAIAAAHTPYYDEIRESYPWTTLAASSRSVGLAEGAAGNAELGHMNIGAGRVMRTVFSRIRNAVQTGEFFQNGILCKAMADVKVRGTSLHLIGLVSDADVHSSCENLYALLRMAKRHGLRNVFVHGILDGRDVPARTADIYVEALEIKLADIGIGRIATLCGRFFAMDSSENWERTARAFTMLVHAEGERSLDPVTAVRSSFLRGIGDEFVAPIVIESEPGVPVATVKDGDLVVFFNHRADTMRQLVRSLAVPDQGLVIGSAKPHIEAVCLAEYDRAFNLPVAFPQRPEPNSLSTLLAENSINNYRISESHRITHVTKFLNCGNEFPNPFEQHFEIGSGDATFRESEPELKSFKVTDRLLRGMEKDSKALFIVNLPAPGLVAETGNFERTVEAVQYVDTCLGGILAKTRAMNGVAIVTGSHGNCEDMLLDDGQPNRFATTNPVPLHFIDHSAAEMKLRPEGSLQDVAPTILGMLGIEKPAEMSGSDLRFT